MNRSQNRIPTSESDIIRLWKSTPPVTRFVFTAICVTSFGAHLGPRKMARHWHLDFYRVFSKMEVWRLGTSLVVHRLGWGFIALLYRFYKFSSELELRTFNGRSADYIYFYMITSSIHWAAAYVFDLPILTRSLVMSAMALWSLRNPSTYISLMGVDFKAKYLPGLDIAIQFLISGAIPLDLMAGFASAYIYNWLEVEYPRRHRGRRPLRTPPILQRLFPGESGGRGGWVWSTWGRGYRLGG
ncbi:uncharacterized protein VTP21DRAFT_10892 [Calcarisporiella thermophila]|uniref:uncharacterized protein n=1 Tax=Calcarisporiella thermophila TaxID=911321 RepID=UPI003743BD3F